MAELPTLNTDLEQALYKAALREKQLRLRATLCIIVPIVVGGLWLLYSAAEVNAWRSQTQEIRAHEAALEQRELDAKHLIAEAEEQRNQAQARVQALEAQLKAARLQAEDVQQRVEKARDETAGLGVLLNDINSARAKASKLMNSEPIETQLAEIRTALAHSLGRIEQQIDAALPASELKPNVYIFYTDDRQRAVAMQLKAALETNGFNVAGIAKNSVRRVDSTEIRYFRQSEDKADAIRIDGLVEKQLGQPGAKILYTADSDHVGAKKYQIWLAKPPAPASSPSVD